MHGSKIFLQGESPPMTKHDIGSHSTERIPVLNPASFTPEISPAEWVASVRAAHIKLPPIWDQPFEVLQPSHLVGRARTNTTLVDPTIVQTDVQSIPAPFAAFDMQKAAFKRAGVTHHFQANGYGSTGIGTFIFSFTVQTLGDQTHFTFEGPGPFGTLIAPGSVGIHDSSRT